MVTPKKSLSAAALIAVLLSAFPAMGADAAASATYRPQLVVNIVVDGLQADYLELLSSYFSNGGFNRLMRDGVVMDRVEYGSGVDAAGAVAMLQTGASPQVNGIATATTFSTERHIPLPTLLDPAKIGNYTDETFSPAALRSSTIGDELRIEGGGVNHVHSLAPDASCAIIMAGHAANSAFWISDTNGKWATTTYYKEVPTTISQRNFSKPLPQRMDTMVWKPSMELDAYPCLPAHLKRYGFRHTFSGGTGDAFRRFRISPCANREVTDVATDYIVNFHLGTHDVPDMLSVAYTVAPTPGSTDARMELMDSYLRLDSDLTRLLETIDREVGADKALVLLTGTPTTAPTEPDDARWGIPTGEFSTRKAQSLLNMYLIALYGNGDWVSDIDGSGVYLNNKLISDRAVNAEDLRSEAAKFLTRMSGVASAWTIDDILEGRMGAELRRNTVAATAPDVSLAVLPGWITLAADGQRTTQRSASTEAPAIIYSPAQLKASRISTPVDARAIAPTVARLLRIRSPNGAEVAPIPLMRN